MLEGTVFTKCLGNGILNISCRVLVLNITLTFSGSTPISAVQFTTLLRTEGRYQLPRISMLVSQMCPQDRSK